MKTNHLPRHKIASERGEPAGRAQFSKRQHVWMLAGLLLVVFGYVLVSGGRSSASSFDPGTIFSFGRITLAPICILLGFFVIAYGIMCKSRPSGEG